MRILLTGANIFYEYLNYIFSNTQELKIKDRWIGL